MITNKIFYRREYGSLQKMLHAIESWIINTKEIEEDDDFRIVIRKV